MARRRTDIDDFDIWYMHEHEDMSIQEIADYNGVSHGCIFYRLHPEKQEDHSKKSKEWQLENPEKKKEFSRKWWQSDEGKAYTQFDNYKASKIKHQFKRRDLGFIPLNNYFEGGEWHHVDEDHVICIPAELHKSIYHNIWTVKNMEAINKEAFEFLEWEMREKQWEDITGDWMVGEY